MSNADEIRNLKARISELEKEDAEEARLEPLVRVLSDIRVDGDTLQDVTFFGIACGIDANAKSIVPLIAKDLVDALNHLDEAASFILRQNENEKFRAVTQKSHEVLLKYIPIRYGS